MRERVRERESEGNTLTDSNGRCFFVSLSPCQSDVLPTITGNAIITAITSNNINSNNNITYNDDDDDDDGGGGGGGGGGDDDDERRCNSLFI